MKYKKNDFICLLFWTNKQTFCNFFSDQLAARWPSDKFLQQGVFLGCWSEFIWKNGFGLKAFFFCFWVNLGPILGEKWLSGQVANIILGEKCFYGQVANIILGEKCLYGQAANIFLGEKWYMGRLPKKYRLGPKTKQPRIRGDAIDLFVIFPSIQDLLAECHLLFFF